MGEGAVKQNKILIVDDVDTNRFLLRDIITEMGYQPLLATNGAQALKIVERLHPQLIISDIAMPEMDGYELCSILKITKNRAYKLVSLSDFPKVKIGKCIRIPQIELEKYLKHNLYKEIKIK